MVAPDVADIAPPTTRVDLDLIKNPTAASDLGVVETKKRHMTKSMAKKRFTDESFDRVLHPYHSF